jgi:undecaprenyl-diphosphatase
VLTLDHVVRAWVVAHRVGALDGVMWTVSAVGRGGLIWLAIAASIAVIRQQREAFTVVLLAVLLGSATADELVKPLVHRTRPFDEMSGTVIGGRPHDPSFPSGHSANAFGAAFTLSRVAPGGAAVWWALAAIVAFSRVYLGVHYPIDVVGGAATGVLCGWLAIWLVALRTHNSQLTTHNSI